MKQNKSVLVIEDTDLLRELLCNSLEADGFKVRACEDGLTAMDAATEDFFHVVITNFRMPHMNGVDVTKRLRVKLPESFIIGVSVEDKREDFLVAGADAFLLKPYNYSDILTFIS